jgi:acyl dehydratase
VVMVDANTQKPDERLYLDDLFVGQRFTSRTHVIDEAQIKAFARQFDPQPFHQDEDAAKDTLFTGLAASGWHTAAITMRQRIAANGWNHRRRRRTRLAKADTAR